ncbi:MAG: hypothetical protein ACTS27_04765 [Phycisphaerales bacterium]
MSRYKRLFSGPVMLLAEARDPTLAFWGRLARVIFPFMLAYPLAIVGMRLARVITSSEVHLFFAGYPVLGLLIGIVALGAGRAAAKMSDEQRAGALPESLLAAGRTSKEYWENQAVLGGLFVAASIFGIALIVVGEF